MSVQSAQLQTSADDTIIVSGALIFDTVNQLWEQSQPLFVRNKAQIRIDLQAVTQSDSAGVALLLAWTRAARSNKTKIVFISLPEQMRAIAKVGGLEEILPAG